MGSDEQQEEREVLASIFPDEITDISENEFRILTQLDINPEDDVTRRDDDEEPSIAPAVILSVKYTTNYPDEAPDLDIMAAEDENSHHPYLDVAKDREQLLSSLTATIEENIGIAMVYALVMALKDTAENLMAQRAQAARDVRNAAVAKAEEEENRKFTGTPVTRESFLAWRDKFRREMELAEERRKAEDALEDKKRKNTAAKDEVKLTGKQLWERGLTGKLDDESYEDGDDALDGMQKLQVAV